MNVRLAYGKHGIDLLLPDGPRYEVLRVHAAPPLPDPGLALERALDAPIGCPSMLEIATGRKTAAISVCDITRPAPNAITLPPLLERLHRAGIQAKDITIFIATGLHRAATTEEINTIVGVELAKRYRIVNHDARRIEDHSYLGETKRGTPVYVERNFVEADLHITLGFIEQHLMLGFSGGRKLIAPGLAAQETIKVIHSPRFMREPSATEGSTTNNPLHAELLEVASMVRHDFILDVTLTQAREISGIFAGDPVAAHAKGVASIKDASLEYLSEPVDAVITSAAGHPLDLTFYQVIKGITAAQHVVKPGGKILVVGECREGIGSAEFAEKLASFRGCQEYLDEIQDTPVDVDQWQLEKLALVGLRNPVLFYTPGISRAQMGSLGPTYFDSLEEATTELLRDLGEESTVAVIPDGPYVYARVKPEHETTTVKMS
jgi:nickel-dependent lactate racemase